MIKEEDVTEPKFDNLEGMLEDLWNATVKDLRNATESEDWYDVPSDEMTLEQARQAVRDLRKKLAEYLEQEPKTGHWIDIMVGDMPTQACDQCNTFYPLAYTGGGHKYCPNCGAKMEVDE